MKQILYIPIPASNGAGKLIWPYSKKVYEMSHGYSCLSQTLGNHDSHQDNKVNRIPKLKLKEPLVI